MTRTDELKTAIEDAIAGLHKLADKIRNMTCDSEGDILKYSRACMPDVISNIHRPNGEKQYAHTASDSSKKYEYRTLTLQQPFLCGFMDSYYRAGWEPMFSTAVVNDYYGVLLLFTIRRLVDEGQQTDDPGPHEQTTLICRP